MLRKNIRIMLVTARCQTSSEQFGNANMTVQFSGNGSESLSRFLVLFYNTIFVLLKYNFDNLGH